jgi:hypothetical protein
MKKKLSGAGKDVDERKASMDDDGRAIMEKLPLLQVS